MQRFSPLGPLPCLFFFRSLSLSFLHVAISEEGFCSAPSSVFNGETSGALYWKVTNPTLSPVHLQDLPGYTRSIYERDHALITPESHVLGPLPEWKNTLGAYLITPATGSHFVMYIAKMQDNSRSALPSGDVERFIFVVSGAVTLTTGSNNNHSLMVDSYAYLPPNFDHAINSEASATLVVFERRYSVLVDHVPELIIGSTDKQQLLKTPGEIFQLRKLLPTSVAYDFNIHVMDFQPGEFLNVKEVHYNQHGLLLLEGQGIYRLGNSWKMSSKRPVGSKKKSGSQGKGEQSQPTAIGPGELRRLQSSMTRPTISPSLSLDHGAVRQLQFTSQPSPSHPSTSQPSPHFEPFPSSQPSPHFEPSPSSQPSPHLEPSPSSQSSPHLESSPHFEPSPSGDGDGGAVEPDAASTSTLDPDGLWFDTSSVVRSITRVIKSYFHAPWKNYTEVDQATKAHWWDMWKKQYSWRPELQGTVRDAYESKAGIRLKDIFNDTVHKWKDRPHWLGEEMYTAMKERVNDAKFKERSDRAKVNRRAGNASGDAPASHCVGSVSVTQRAKKLAKEQDGKFPDAADVFLDTHFK